MQTPPTPSCGWPPSPSLRCAAADKKISFSRRDARPRHVKQSAEHQGGKGKMWWVSLLSPTLQATNKKEAERRQAHVFRCSASTPMMRLALNAARSPDGVPPRYLRPRTNAAAQLQNALPGTWLSAGVIRRPLSQSSDKVADRSSCRPGVFPLAARERR